MPLGALNYSLFARIVPGREKGLECTDPRAPDVHAVEAIADPTEKPADGSKLQMVQWALMLPLQLIMKVTIPGEKSITEFNLPLYGIEHSMSFRLSQAPPGQVLRGHLLHGDRVGVRAVLHDGLDDHHHRLHAQHPRHRHGTDLRRGGRQPPGRARRHRSRKVSERHRRRVNCLGLNNILDFYIN